MAGGSTFISCGNGVRCLEQELKEHGLDLSADFKDAEKDMQIKPINEGSLSEGTLHLNVAAQSLGYAFDPMPKFIDSDKCTGCSRCVFGCVHGAKWTALEYLDEAQVNCVEILNEHEMLSLQTSIGRVTGITVRGPKALLKLKQKSWCWLPEGLEPPSYYRRPESGDLEKVSLLTRW